MQYDAWQLLSELTFDPASGENILKIKSQLGFAKDEDTFERDLLRDAAHKALALVDVQPVDASVVALMKRELQKMLTSEHPGIATSLGYRTAASIATLRRFTAGPMDWELGGVPRSWILRKLPKADGIRLLWFVTGKLGGVYPLLHTHVAPAPRRRSLLIEKEVLRCYARMAKSLERQPHVLGIMGAAWFHDQAAVRDNPHLEPLNRPFVRYGGLIVNVGPAPADAGFLEHNPARKAAFEAGELQYQIGMAVWPRKAALEWVRANPELLE